MSGSGVASVLNADLIAKATLAVVAFVAVSALVAAFFHRRRRAHLLRLASRHSMSLTSGPAPRKYSELSGRFRGTARKVSVSGLMLGSSDDGLFAVTRRIGRVRQQLLYFELGSTAHLDRFFVVPETVKGERGAQLNLHWSGTKAQWNDEKALSMSARVLYGVSSLGSGGAPPELGVEVQGHRVWIHSMRAVRGADLDRFMDDAMRLRQLLRKSLERTNGIVRKSASSGSVSRARSAPSVQPLPDPAVTP